MSESEGDERYGCSAPTAAECGSIWKSEIQQNKAENMSMRHEPIRCNAIQLDILVIHIHFDAMVVMNIERELP